MAQRPILRAGIAEGNIAELDLVLSVGALLGRERALIHLVRRIEEGEELLQKRRVAAHVAAVDDELREMPGKGGERGDILHNAARAERARERLQAYEKVRCHGEQHREQSAHDHQHTAAAPRELCERAVRTERRIGRSIALADVLLVIHADVARAVAVADRHDRKEVEKPVAEARERCELCREHRGAVHAQRRQHREQSKQQQAAEQKQRMVQHRPRPGAFRHALREERHGEGDNAQNTKNGHRQLRLHIEHAPQTVAGPFFVLEDLGEIVVRFGIVQPGEIHVQQLVGVDLLVDIEAVVVQNRLPALERGGDERQQRRRGHGGNGEHREPVRVPRARQLADDLRGKPDQHIRRERFERGVKPVDRVQRGPFGIKELRRAAVQPPRLARGYFFLILFHRFRPPPGNTCSALQRARRIFRRARAAPRGCPARR